MTDATALLEVHTAVLDMFRKAPKPFAKYARMVAEDDFPDADLSEDLAMSCLEEDQALLGAWRQALTRWDTDGSPGWTASAARTEERRSAVHERLGFGAQLRKALDTLVPVSLMPAPVVIATEHEEWTPSAAPFYWPAYERVLRSKKWSENAIATLDEASSSVVDRLADPSRPAAYQSKGLVVGYVQSGKTANFTGVAAKAVDAGYRLVIVLGGTLNLLREQTQRRLDMELVGRENILRGTDPSDEMALADVDYQDDADWRDGKFLEHGGRPVELGAFDIERLTTRDSDYKSLLQGITALEFEKREPSLPLYDPRNLHRTAARLMVVKKNKTVLSKLVRDLKKIRTPLAEIPALIIDDESDQASVNTSDPKKWQAGQTERTAINGLISQLIKLLPRAQYVGYTATPFANVFIDPGDGEDIFPRDFLISLPPPEGYMGIRDFHDLEPGVPVAERTVGDSQEKAYVRGLYADPGTPEDEAELQQALDTYVLTGAVKLYRAAHGQPEGPYRHHTMLVHESVRTADHRALAGQITKMYWDSGYTGPTGHDRLKKLFVTDIRPVSAARGAGLPLPDTYEELMPYVSQARQLIAGNGFPVMVVNGDKDLEQPDLDFTRQPNVWKILVGGTKLSRGFTVEGLTTTYYRRTTQQADTLMQMGRWFGFRPGYQDLVRLFIGRSESVARRAIDLYQAFEAICLDEEAFRTQLAQYAKPVDGLPQITPAQVPPLVAQHLPWIKPSARNKMFNAEIVEIRSPGRWIEPGAYPERAIALRANTECWLPVLRALGAGKSRFVHLDPERPQLQTEFPAKTAVLKHEQLLKILRGLVWERPDLFAPHLEYLSGSGIDDWAVIAPQTTGPRSVAATICDAGPFNLVERSRSASGRINRLAGYAHRQSPERIAGLLPVTALDPGAAALASPNRGALLLYPAVDPAVGTPADLARSGSIEPGKVLMAFALLPPQDPATAGRQLIRFRAANSSQPDAPIVDVVPPAGAKRP